VIKEITELSGWYFLNGQFYIISDFPGAAEKQKEHPEIEALPLAELERMTADKIVPHGTQLALTSVDSPFH
jgi:hypothetical protein